MKNSVPEPDPRVVYGDIIGLPHHVSDRYPPMSMAQRAAQFAPFAALTGYDEVIGEEARQVDRRIELSEEDQEILDRELRRLGGMADRGERPRVSVTFFPPDPLKPGGRYETVTERLKKIDTAGRTLLLDRKVGLSRRDMAVLIPDILEIREAPL